MSTFHDARLSSGPRSLPSIHALLSIPGFSCRYCGATFDRAEHRDQHQDKCVTASRCPLDRTAFCLPTSKPSSATAESTARSTVQQQRWLSIDSIDGSLRNPNEDLGNEVRTSPSRHYESDDSGVHFPQTISRGNSLRTGCTSRPTSRARTPSANEQDKKEHKKQKEKHARQQMSLILQCSEDMHQNYLNFKSGNLQSAGNGNEAGLELVKIDNHMGNLSLLNYFLHRDHMRALEEHQLDEWRAKMRAILVGWRSNTTVLTKGTWLDDESGRSYGACEHRRGDKACIKHKHPDHRRCRKDRHRKNYLRHMEMWKAQQAQSIDTNTKG